MIGSEFEEWQADVKARWSEAGDFFTKLPSETTQIWFKDVFSRLQLDDCLKANEVIFKTESMGKYSFVKLPVLITRISSEVAQARWRKLEKARASREAAETASYRKRQAKGDRRLLGGQMIEAFEAAEKFVQARKREHYVAEGYDGEQLRFQMSSKVGTFEVPVDDVSEFVDNWFEGNS